MQRFSRTVFRNSAIGLLAQFAIKILSFGFSIVVVRRLGAEAFGQYAGVMAFGGIFVPLSDLGLSPYFVREVARRRERAEVAGGIAALYGDVLALRIGLAVLTSLVLIAMARLVKLPTAMVGAIALSSLGLCFYAVQGTCAAVLAGFERLDRTARATVINQVIFVGCGGVALWLGSGYYGLIGAMLIGVAVLTILCWREVRRCGIAPQRADWRRWLPLLRASLPFGLISLALGFSYKFDSVILTTTRGSAETGYYNAAYNLVFSAAVLSNALNTALYPSLARQAERSPHHLPAIYARALRYLLVLGLPIAIIGSLAAGRLVPLLFGGAYAPAARALQIVIWVVPLMYVSEFLGYVVVIGGHERRAARSVVIGTVCNVVLNLLIVPRYGFVGAAAITVATEAILVGQYLWLLRDLARDRAWWSPVLRLGPIGLALGALGWALAPLPLVVGLGASAACYGGLLVVCRVVGREEIAFLRGLRGGGDEGE